MVKSMTGFGRKQLTDNGYTVSCEIRSVNHRYLDTNIRLSRRYASLEDPIVELVKKYVTRGRIEISINIEKTETASRNIKVDKELALTYYSNLKEIAEILNIPEQIKVIDLFRLPEVFNLEDREEDLEKLWSVLSLCIDAAMQDLIIMREREGQNLAKDILMRNNLIADMVEELEARSPIVVKEHTEKIRHRISELISQEFNDEQRILQEAAIFADRASVTEEIIRLKSHVNHLVVLMDEPDSNGRKCDFLVQEMFREINTIASKANDVEMSKIVVNAKAELEKIREQLQNIE
ncbi:MAG: YicC family protein [Syntrophomonadaceae bacterium]|nr:YicC family protein [Syntrophomonadaceae bacterium]